MKNLCNKEKFVTPQITVIYYTSADIITASSTDSLGFKGLPDVFEDSQSL